MSEKAYWPQGTYLGCPLPTYQKDNPTAHSSGLARFNTCDAAHHDAQYWLDKGKRYMVLVDESGYFWATYQDKWLLAKPHRLVAWRKARGGRAPEDLACLSRAGFDRIGEGCAQKRAVVSSDGLV